jgi:hypothetical protein
MILFKIEHLKQLILNHVSVCVFLTLDFKFFFLNEHIFKYDLYMLQTNYFEEKSLFI